MQQNLAQLSTTKEWIGATSAANDPVLTRMILACSRAILNYLQRPTVFKTTFTRTLNGSGASYMMLPDWPVLSVSSLAINGTVVNAAVNPQNSGFSLEPWAGFCPAAPQMLSLNGYSFSGICSANGGGYRMAGGQLNVQISYIAGYSVQNEPQTAAARVSVAQDQGRWGQDDGVTMNGVAMTKAPEGTTPATGQYALGEPGFYIFAAADYGQPVLISYSYVPFDLEQACIEWVSERYNYKARVGQRSSSLGGQETASFDLSGMPDFIKTMLRPYRKVMIQ